MAAASDQVLVWEDATGLSPALNCENVISPGAEGLAEYLQDVMEISDSPAQDQLVLSGSFWQAQREGEGLKAVRCYDGPAAYDYILFSVHRPESETAVATVGVRAGQTLLFKNVTHHTAFEAEQAIDDRVPSGAAVQPASLVAGVASAEGEMAYVVCTDSSELNVRDESLSKILFTARRFETVKPVQSFGTDQVQKTIGGHVYSFVKVQFPSRAVNEGVGWIADNYLKLKSQCPGAIQAPPESDAPGLASGWNFPTIKRPTSSYKTGQRRFKAGRSGGRLHAACDLYRKKDETAQAVNSGKVIRDRYYFYEGTYALEIRHSDGKVVRYGEITGRAASGVRSGATVSSGQTVGYIGKVNSNCCEPMLHFEMYSGRKTGPLTTSGNSFRRRSDLIDPTSYLVDWEKLKFGASY
jgi:murein DD-endopeptidase MepM/ murein hydrolase activator NlpD